MSRISFAHFIFALGWMFCYCLSGVGKEVAAERSSNWQRFRGPEGTGAAALANPPTKWDEQTNIKWKVEVPGQGSASPIVWEDRIFLVSAIKTDRTSLAFDELKKSSTATELAESFSANAPVQLVQFDNPPPSERPPRGERPRRGKKPPRGEESLRGRRGRGGFFGFGRGQAPTNVYQFVVLCLDRATGDTLWQRTACEAIPHEGHHGTASFASASPVTDGKNLYVSFGSRGIYSYDLDGNLRWKRDLGHMRTRNSFGEGASPALYGNTLIINWDQEDQSFIVALDADSGEIRWRADRDEATSWATPLIVEHGGKTQVLVNGTNRIRSYDIDSGELIWECGGQAMNPVATPVIYDDLGIFMTGRRGHVVQAVKLDSLGDVSGTEQIAWEHDDGTPYVPSPLLVEDRLYFIKSNNAILTCVSAATGEFHYKNQRLQGLRTIYSSPVSGGGHVYISDRDGNTLVLQEGPEFEIVATNYLGEPIDATPALVGDEILIRGEKHLFCIAE